MHAMMHIRHEGVEMHAPLFPHGHGVEEQVHQHGFAATDRTPDIQPARRRLPSGAEQPAQRAGFLPKLIFGQRVGQTVQFSHDAGLRGIGLDRAVPNQGVVGIENVGSHEGREREKGCVLTNG